GQQARDPDLGRRYADRSCAREGKRAVPAARPDATHLVSERLRPSDSPTRSLARRFDGALRFRLRESYGGRAEAPAARRRARGSLTMFARGGHCFSLMLTISTGVTGTFSMPSRVVVVLTAPILS